MLRYLEQKQKGGAQVTIPTHSSNTQQRENQQTLTALKTKILVDGADPRETAMVRRVIGFVDGQTTNPSLVAKSPQTLKKLSLGRKLSEQEERDVYKATVQALAPLVGSAGVSIEVFSDLNTTAEEMLYQAREMNAWIPNAYIKYPCTREGLEAAHRSVQEGIRVNITLCFSQEQVAAVYAATLGAPTPVYVSPFVGRLNDIGLNGLDLLKNIQQMFAQGDGHVHILAASIRSLEQLLYCFHREIDLVTVPARILEEWAARNFPLPGPAFSWTTSGAPIEYHDIDLNRTYTDFNIEHELTRKGIERFVADYHATLMKAS